MFELNQIKMLLLFTQKISKISNKINFRKQPQKLNYMKINKLKKIWNFAGSMQFNNGSKLLS